MSPAKASSTELLDEVESVLGIQCAPVTWPIGMGKRVRGVYHLFREEVLVFAAGGENREQTVERIAGINNPELDRRFPEEMSELR